MSKFGYVRREATDQVDWGAVATQFTTILNEEAKSRESQKKELADRSREMVETLQNSPTGDYVDGNTFVADYASSAQQVLLTQDRLLRQGILKPREYSIVRANLNDSNKQMFKLGEAYQEAYKLKMERMNSADPATRSQMVEQWKMEQAEGLYNLRNTKALINPNNGMVSIGLWKDGQMDSDPSSFQTVPELMSNLKGTYDYYDVRTDINTAVDDLGLIDELSIELSGKEGGLDRIITTTSQGGKYSGDAQLIKEYNEWAGYTADAMMANPWHVTSILTNENLTVEIDGKKVPYTFTYEKDPKKRAANEIYLNRDNDMGGQPEFTDDQKKTVKDAIKERLNDSVDKKIKASTSRQPFESQSNIIKGETDKKNQKTFNMLSDIFYGNQKEVDAAETYFRDVLGATDVQKKGNIIYVTNSEGITKPVPMVDSEGNLMDFETFAESAALLTGVSNIADSVDLAGGVRKGKVASVTAGEKDGTYVIKFEGGREEVRKVPKDKLVTDLYPIGKTIQLGSLTETGSGAGATSEEGDQQYLNRYLQTALTYNNVLQDTGGGQITDDKAVINKLTPYLDALGLETNNYSNWSNSVQVRPDGDTSEGFILYTNKEPEEMQKQLRDLNTYIMGAVAAENIVANEALLAKIIGPRQTGKGGKPKAYE